MMCEWQKMSRRLASWGKKGNAGLDKGCDREVNTGVDAK